MQKNIAYVRVRLGPSYVLLRHSLQISMRYVVHCYDRASVFQCPKVALLRVYNDIVTMVGKGNGSYLVLLDLSAAFDTIDHDTLFVILEKYVGITGSSLQL